MKTKRVTYEDIVTYVRRRWGLSIATCSIAHVKALNDLPVRRAPNRIGRGHYRDNPWPRKHRPRIERALRHFGIL